jgi:hypothetical protein
MQKVLQTTTIDTDQLAAAEPGFQVDVISGKPLYPLSNHTISSASTNAKVVKSSKGIWLGGVFANTTGSYKFVKLYDKATAPTVGTDIPKFTIGIPANWSREISIPPVVFQNGLAMAIVTGAADTDATAVAVNDVTADILYL